MPVRKPFLLISWSVFLIGIFVIKRKKLFSLNISGMLHMLKLLWNSNKPINFFSLMKLLNYNKKKYVELENQQFDKIVILYLFQKGTKLKKYRLYVFNSF